jgi:GrpB-like predicted nucleotidyltransferase (UPF0157 family)
MEIDEVITVVPYATHWPQLFSNEQQHLKVTLGNTLIDIQHVEQQITG